MHSLKHQTIATAVAGHCTSWISISHSEGGSAFLPPETEDKTSELRVYLHGTLGKSKMSHFKASTESRFTSHL